MGATEVNDLKLFIDHDADLYRQQHTSILKNLATKKARGQYKHDLAVKLFGYLVESGAKKYADKFGLPGQPWHKMFDVSTRTRVAEALTDDFEEEFKLGNFDQLLPKKYQRAVSAHASKKTTWRAPEGLEIAYSPVNQAYFALWPANRNRSDQQVLKVASADEMHDWLRERYGSAYGRGGRSHSRRSSVHERLHDPAAQRAREEAARRGISGHARKRAQLDREIGEHVPMWRGGKI